MRLFLILALIVYITNGCDPTDSRLTVVNRSARTIFFTLNGDCVISDSSPYWQGYSENEMDERVAPHSETRIQLIGNWESHIAQEYKNQTLCLYIFDQDTLLKYPWNHVRENNMFLHKFEIELEALKKMNWRVTYDAKLDSLSRR